MSSINIVFCIKVLDHILFINIVFLHMIILDYILSVIIIFYHMILTYSQEYQQCLNNNSFRKNFIYTSIWIAYEYFI